MISPGPGAHAGEEMDDVAGVARRALPAHWRFLETGDECFPYASGSRVPPRGRWDISAVALSSDVLARVYVGNADRLLSAPQPETSVTQQIQPASSHHLSRSTWAVRLLATGTVVGLGLVKPTPP
ncbi:hypothetical protein GCM10009779_38830 [Polymorphospora rubra]|uniref:Uncharacterized protein n=1 Tax=Polymorphospora rubra TaxID=338584 RepID=A0A810N853_9ACTN|nr:hypothetical protein Prubr_66070 [Polymorphospora rubra]